MFNTLKEVAFGSVADLTFRKCITYFISYIRKQLSCLIQMECNLRLLNLLEHYENHEME